MNFGVVAIRIEPDRGLMQPMGNGRIIGPRRVVGRDPRRGRVAVQLVADPDAEVIEGKCLQASVDLTVEEDSPQWDCRRDGNRKCGEGAVLPDGSLAAPV